jgi:hypothetical protein
MKTILILILLAVVHYAQTHKIENIKGSVKAQIGSEEKWIDVKEGTTLKPNSTIITGEKSSVKIVSDKLNFTLKESSAISVSNIKKMTLDELLLALAMEDMMNAPRKKEKTNGKNTAVYGTEEKKSKDQQIVSDDFGVKKLNGALQLSESGFKESAVVTAKETFRKYPSTKSIAHFRIYFANILYDRGLYEEAYDEFSSIKNLNLSEKERLEVENKLELLRKKLVNK